MMTAVVTIKEEERKSPRSCMSRRNGNENFVVNGLMLNSLMAISIEGPPSKYNNAQRALELRWHGGQTARL